MYRGWYLLAYAKLAGRGNSILQGRRVALLLVLRARKACALSKGSRAIAIWGRLPSGRWPSRGCAMDWGRHLLAYAKLAGRSNSILRGHRVALLLVLRVMDASALSKRSRAVDLWSLLHAGRWPSGGVCTTYRGCWHLPSCVKVPGRGNLTLHDHRVTLLLVLGIRGTFARSRERGNLFLGEIPFPWQRRLNNVYRSHRCVDTASCVQWRNTGSFGGRLLVRHKLDSSDDASTFC